jgi:hypothetical protein
MPLPYSTSNFQGIPEFQKFRLRYALLEMNYPLTAYVVNDQRLCMPWKSFQGLAHCIIHVDLSIRTISNTVILMVSDIPTALLSENRPHNVGQMCHVLHTCTHPYPLNPNVSDGGYCYSVLGDYYISISSLC